MLPQCQFYRRPAAIHYAQFWFLFRIFQILSTTLSYINVTADLGNCVYVIGCLYPFAITEPLILYYTLLQDSK